MRYYPTLAQNNHWRIQEELKTPRWILYTKSKDSFFPFFKPLCYPIHLASGFTSFANHDLLKKFFLGLSYPDCRKNTKEGLTNYGPYPTNYLFYNNFFYQTVSSVSSIIKSCFGHNNGRAEELQQRPHSWQSLKY